MKKVYTQTKEIEICGNYDIIVVGGGAAGCAAALTAGRLGAEVLLCERYGFLGGATAAQGVGHILSTNGVDFMGVWHDFIREVNRLGGLSNRDLTTKGEDNRIRSGVDIELVKFAWDNLLSKAQVNMLHHVWASGVMKEENKITGVILETVSGTMAVQGKMVIDATGDGAVCAFAGAPFSQGDGEHPYNQALTKVFRMGNVDRSVVHTKEEIQKLVEKAASDEMAKRYESEVVKNGRAASYTASRTVPNSIPKYRTEMHGFASRVLHINPVDPWDLTKAEREGRKQAYECADFAKRYISGFENAYLLDTNIHIGIRDSRRIQGIETVLAEDALMLNKRKGSIAKSSWVIDIWPGDHYARPAVQDSAQRIEKVLSGDYFDIPYGAIVVKGAQNLFVAGRCISAEREAQASLRIQQTCQATGEAAGFAAVFCLKHGISPDKADGVAVAKELAQHRSFIKPVIEELLK
jgi:hypothetical protein